MKKNVLKNIALKGAVAVLAALIYFLIFFGDGGKQPIATKVVEDVPARAEDDSLSIPEEDLQAAKTEAAKRWTYKEKKDEMTDGTNRWAVLRSENCVYMKMPYDGGTYATLAVRYTVAYGTDVYIEVDRGQIDGDQYRGTNYVRIRFDDEQPDMFKFNEAADGSADIVFLKNAKGFISKAKKAKRIKVEVPFYQEGRQVFDFSVDESLKW